MNFFKIYIWYMNSWLNKIKTWLQWSKQSVVNIKRGLIIIYIFIRRATIKFVFIAILNDYFTLDAMNSTPYLDHHQWKNNHLISPQGNKISINLRCTGFFGSYDYNESQSSLDEALDKKYSFKKYCQNQMT